MSNWKCGKCGTVYKFDDFLKLGKVRVKTKEEDPENAYGYNTKCKCGYVFFKDKWNKRTTLEVKIPWVWFITEKVKLDVSTTFLELDHFGYYYETMIFRHIGKKIDYCGMYQTRHKTKSQAKSCHSRLVRQLKNNKVKLIKKENDYILEGIK